MTFSTSDGAPLRLPIPSLEPGAALDVLRHGDVEILGRMPWSSNGTYLVLVEHEGVEIGAIYKPRQGERPLWDFPDGTLCQREVGAYELSAALGWDIVPETVLRDGPLGVGMLQRYVDHDPEEQYFTLLPEHADRFRAFAAFDIAVNNTDRKGGHCLLDRASGQVIGIDHGVTFHPAWKLRTVIWDFYGEPVPEPLLDDLRRIRYDLEPVLAPLLSTVEVQAAALRIEELLETAEYPEPAQDYHSFPWPLV